MTLSSYAVDGAMIAGATLRRSLWESTNGTEGITFPTALRVTALATPGGAVNVAPGGARMLNRYLSTDPAAITETYSMSADATFQVAIPATGSAGGRTDYLIMRVKDWHFGDGQEPADPDTFDYAYVDRVSSLAGIAYPFIALAQVVIPASTGTITNAMITDLRTMASPRTHDFVRPIPAVTSDTGMTLTNTNGTGEYFPNGDGNHLGPTTIDVPVWATRVQIMCTWIGVLYPNGENPWGSYWVEWGDYVDAHSRELSTQKFAFDAPAGTNTRVNWILGGDQYVPAKYRGTSALFVPKATLGGGSGVKMDARSGMLWNVRFLEVADPGIV